MARKRWLRSLAAIALAGVPLATSISCDGEAFSFLRFDDNDSNCGYFGFVCDDYYYDDYYYDDCGWGDCYEDDWYYF
jgi:hypothetical protein